MIADHPEIQRMWRDAFDSIDAHERASLIEAALKYLAAGVPADVLPQLLTPIVDAWRAQRVMAVAELTAVVEQHDGVVVH